LTLASGRVGSASIDGESALRKRAGIPDYERNYEHFSRGFSIPPGRFRREIRARRAAARRQNAAHPAYAATAQNAHVIRPLNNDYTSPARETVPRFSTLKQTISWTLTPTTRL